MRDYFLGGRTAPWWALALSIVATETSTLTIVGTPALAFSGNLTFLQFVLGYLAGRMVIVLLFLPHYFRAEFYTAYQLMERRFGAKVKAVAACTFLVTRVLAEGVRVAAIALVVAVALGTGQRTSILLIMALVLLYTFEGGMKAVIWTDVAQFLLYFSGSLVAFFLLLHRIPGGWQAVLQAAAPAQKLRVSGFFFQFHQSRQAVHVLVGPDRRKRFHHGQSRNRSNHRAALVGGAFGARQQDRAAGQRRSDPRAVCAVPGAGRDALRMAWCAGDRRRTQLRFRLPRFHRHGHAAGSSRPAYRRDFGRGYVQRQRLAEFAGRLERD